MLTPETASEIAKSAWVTARAQPPFWIRFGALLNDPQNSGMSPTSVAGGFWNEGNWLASGGFCGPGSDRPAGLALTAPCAGESGLPNEAARAAVATAAAPPAPPRARTWRREKGITGLSYWLSGTGACRVLPRAEPTPFNMGNNCGRPSQREGSRRHTLV